MTCLRSPDTLSVYSETTHPPSATALRRSTPSARVDERFFNVRTDAGPALNLWLHPSSVLVTEPISLREGGGGSFFEETKQQVEKQSIKPGQAGRQPMSTWMDFHVLFIGMVKVSTKTGHTSDRRKGTFLPGIIYIQPGAGVVKL